MNLLLTLDVGTTSVKASLYDSKFKLLGFSSTEYELKTFPGNIVEIQPENYWKASRECIKEAVQASRVDPMGIRGITITTQGETLIPLDIKGKALRDAIVWLDARAEREASFINEGFEKSHVYSVTGLPGIDAACPISKVIWIKNNEPHIYKKTFKFLLLEDYLIYKFTGKFITEKSLMSSTGYFDIKNGCLWDSILEYSGIEPEKFPAVFECGTEAGGILPDVAEELGINPSAIISTGAMDQAASAVGAGNISEGMLTETTGTALVIAATMEQPVLDNSSMVTVYRHALKDKYLVISYCQTAGIILKWFKDEFCLQEVLDSRNSSKSPYELMNKLAEKVPVLSDGLILLPYFSGKSTPEFSSKARGVFFGMGLDTKRGHFIRAIFESIAYMLRENIEVLENFGLRAEEIISLGGGSNSSLMSQIKADVNNKTIITMKHEESTSLGAAILGSICTGLYTDVNEACKVIQTGDIYKPIDSNRVKYAEGYKKYKILYDSVKELF